MTMGEILEMITNGLGWIDVDIIRVLEFTPELMHLFAYRDAYCVVLHASVECVVVRFCIEVRRTLLVHSVFFLRCVIHRFAEWIVVAHTLLFLSLILKIFV
ncbi:hypothetical protein C474_14384 [Halogeometricum pallidum JCM 14848]|uniref:Uncharacterized protein n=1 Tax=Halogeometricum pallidum JCM 14848 TaxID=1227487 RepID=M0CZM4_HALPD|nr:hypothetical protein C474_14384 [Halogeometricum pallidum JCM 14848]